MTVYLVGAGPGSPDLLTLRAARLLAQADVVVHDRLISPEILALAPATAVLVDAGKGPGDSLRQASISALLVEFSRSHEHVVRLKGGDPFLFGRGGEEAVELLAAGVPFEVVPGVSSALAAPAAAGIPVTYRGVSSAVTVVAGHRRADEEDTTDWHLLAGLDHTLVVLMGAERRAQIAAGLLSGGLAPETPVAAVRWATTNRQEVVRGTLRDLADLPVRSPATLVIGAVAGFDLRWVDVRELADVR